MVFTSAACRLFVSLVFLKLLMLFRILRVIRIFFLSLSLFRNKYYVLGSGIDRVIYKKKQNKYNEKFHILKSVISV